MTRKDFVLIAQAIGSLHPQFSQEDIMDIADQFSHYLIRSNARFNTGIFLAFIKREIQRR